MTDFTAHDFGLRLSAAFAAVGALCISKGDTLVIAAGGFLFGSSVVASAFIVADLAAKTFADDTAAPPPPAVRKSRLLESLQRGLEKPDDDLPKRPSP